MGYALFAQKKIELTGRVNLVQMTQTQASDAQMKLATDTLSLQSRISAIQTSQSSELGDLYTQLASSTDSDDRASINAIIEASKATFEGEIDTLNQQMYQVSLKENVIEMEVKRLDTKLTALKKQLEKIEEAESEGIEKATPAFKGLG